MDNGVGNDPGRAAGAWQEYDNDLGRFVGTLRGSDIDAAVKRAFELNERPVFLEGLARRLTELGVPCGAGDEEIMLAQVKSRYYSILDKPCPKTVVEWVRGTVPGVTNRLNNYDLCFALEMDFETTASFFEKHYLTIPFNCRSSTDAVFMYCLKHGRSYDTIRDMLLTARAFTPREDVHTDSEQIRENILEINDDGEFLRYLSRHCCSDEHCFRLAKEKILEGLEPIRASILQYAGAGGKEGSFSPDRLNSSIIDELLGYKYQAVIKEKVERRRMPKRFSVSLPNDVTLGMLLRGEKVSYETLRKTLILIRFRNFYYDCPNGSEEDVKSNLMDFYSELNSVLRDCGFAELYALHPFDSVILYCAGTMDPVEELHELLAGGDVE